jgi:hypothetical protein
MITTMGVRKAAEEGRAFGGWPASAAECRTARLSRRTGRYKT